MFIVERYHESTCGNVLGYTHGQPQQNLPKYLCETLPKGIQQEGGVSTFSCKYSVLIRLDIGIISIYYKTTAST